MVLCCRDKWKEIERDARAELKALIETRNRRTERVFLVGVELKSRQSRELTRAALSTCGRPKTKFLSAKVKSCCSEGESPSGLAESRRSLERKN